MDGPECTQPEMWSGRRLFRLIWPLVIEQVLAVTMGAADTVMVRSVGEHAVAAVNIVDNINNLLVIAFAALCSGGAVVVSQFVGRRDGKNACFAARQLVYVVTAASIALAAVGALGRRPIVRLLYGAIAGDVMDGASVYFLITALSYPALAVYNANAAIFRAMGNTAATMRIALLVNIMNIGGNALFIYGLKIGVAGAALSTLVSRVTAAAITLALLTHARSAPVNLAGLHRVAFSRRVIRSILNVGVPSALESSMFQIGRLATQRIFTSFGTAAIAANAVASVVNSFSFMPGQAFGFALVTIVGQCVGAGDYAAARRNTARVMKYAWLTILVCNVLIYVFLERLIRLFTLSPEGHAYAVQFLRVHCISMAVGWAASFALPNALRAAGDARYVMIAASLSMWFVRVSLAYLLTFPLGPWPGIGPLGVWAGMGADFLSRGTLYALRWRSGKWQTKRVIT